MHRTAETQSDAAKLRTADVKFKTMLDLQVSKRHKPEKMPNTLLYQLLVCFNFMDLFLVHRKFIGSQWTFFFTSKVDQKTLSVLVPSSTGLCL